MSDHGESREEFERDRFGTAGPVSERTYTYAEMLLNQAAAMREAAAHVENDPLGHSRDIQIAADIRALIPTDYATALADRVQQAVREELGKLCNAADLIGDPYKIYGLIQDAHRAAAGAPEEKSHGNM